MNTIHKLSISFLALLTLFTLNACTTEGHGRLPTADQELYSITQEWDALVSDTQEKIQAKFGDGEVFDTNVSRTYYTDGSLNSIVLDDGSRYVNVVHKALRGYDAYYSKARTQTPLATSMAPAPPASKHDNYALTLEEGISRHHEAIALYRELESKLLS